MRSGITPVQHPHVVWLMAVRVVVITTILITAFLIHFATGQFFTELHTIYLLVGTTYVLTLVYVVFAVFWRAYKPQVYIQLLGDVMIITGLVYISGGLVSPFPFLYILAIITGSILLYRRGGFVLASASCISYWALVDLMQFKVLPPVSAYLELSSELRPDHIYYSLAITVIGFYSVAMMTGYLAESLRKADRTIENKSEDLAQLSALHRNVITSMMNGLMTTDAEGMITSANPEALRFLGLKENEILGTPIGKVFDRGGRHQAAMRESMAYPGSYSFEEEVRTRAGQARIFGIRVSRILDRHGKFQGFVYLFDDLTEMKRLEKEVRLKEQMASLGELAAGIAHEIRNPLAAMSGSIQLLKGLDGEQERDTLMRIFLNESDRLNRIIEDFLYYARPQEPLPLICSVSKILSETTALLRNSSEFTADHRLDLSFGGNGVVDAYADPNQLRQVVWNLCRNALQAMPEGGILEISARNEPDRWTRIDFRDEGFGMDDDMTDKLFHTFSSNFRGGTGLGLAIVYRILKAHQGKVEFLRNPDKGITVRIGFPPGPEAAP